MPTIREQEATVKRLERELDAARTRSELSLAAKRYMRERTRLLWMKEGQRDASPKRGTQAPSFAP